MKSLPLAPIPGTCISVSLGRNRGAIVLKHAFWNW